MNALHITHQRNARTGTEVWHLTAQPVTSRTLNGSGRGRMAPIAEIIKRAAACYGIEAAEITGPQRLKNTVRARRLAMSLCRHLTDLSFEELGRIFHHDHQSVINACRFMAGELAKPESLDAWHFLELRIRLGGLPPAQPSQITF